MLAPCKNVDVARLGNGAVDMLACVNYTEACFFSPLARFSKCCYCCYCGCYLQNIISILYFYTESDLRSILP